MELSALVPIGTNLKRPECVLANAHGDLFCADWGVGVAHLHADGRIRHYGGTMPDGLAARPNGIALLADGSFLWAQLGDTDGGVYQLRRDGQIRPWLREVQGLTLPPTNFVVQDHGGRTWITVSTRLQPRAAAYRSDVADGFIVCVPPDGKAFVAADGLGYTNEVTVHPSGRWLYVNETFARRLSRFVLKADGTLGPRETVVEFGSGTFPDGLAFDEAGNAWVVSIVSNRLIGVAPDGRWSTHLEDAEPENLQWVETAYRQHAMGRPHLDGVRSQRLRNISSLAFCGPDRRHAVLGCLLGDHLLRMAMPHPGVAPFHWNFV